MVNLRNDPVLPASSWREQAVEWGETAREQFAEKLRIIRDFAIDRPATAVGIALGMGVFLGWLIRRR